LTSAALTMISIRSMGGTRRVRCSGLQIWAFQAAGVFQDRF